MAELTDPLQTGVALGGVKTDLPLLPEKDYVVQCKESTVDPNKDRTGHNWNTRFETTEQIEAIDGRTVNPGFSLFHINALQAKEDSKDQDAFRRGIAQTVDALYGTDENTRPDLNKETVDGAVGKTCIATVYIDEYQGQKRNKIRRLKAIS